MVVQGNDSTLPVTMDQMVYHCRAVSRGAKRAHVVGDLPFLSYQASVPEAVKNAGRLLAEGGVSSVKLEGGAEFAETIEAIVRAGIPVMGHLGLTPQSVHQMGGYVVQGREEEQARAIYRDAQRAGASRLLLGGARGRPARSWRATSPPRSASPPSASAPASTATARCWSATTCFGFNPDFKPKFVKRYADGYGVLRGAAEAFFAEVRGGTFPGDEHSFTSKTPLRIVPGQRGAATSSSADDGEGGSAVRRPGLMRLLRTPAELSDWTEAARREGRRVGLVPTMGFLHRGHTEPHGGLAGACRSHRGEHLREPHAVRAERGPGALPAGPRGRPAYVSADAGRRGVHPRGRGDVPDRAPDLRRGDAASRWPVRRAAARGTSAAWPRW